MTDWIWVASSLVGERTRACVSRWVVLIVCKMEMENVAVFPVPDCAVTLAPGPYNSRIGHTLSNNVYKISMVVSS